MLDTIERDRGSEAVARLPDRVSERVRQHARLDALRASSPTATIPLTDAEELLLAIDSVLGDGSGRVLEVAMFELATRVLSQAGAVVVGDLHGTVARLRTALERPFVDAEVVFELKKSDTGFTLTVGLPGQPRSTRILRHLATGAIRAAQRFSREAESSDFRLYGEALGDRATIDARYRAPEIAPHSSKPPAPFSRRPSRSMRAPQSTLSDEVERILSQRKPSVEPSPVSTRPSRTSERPPQGSDPGGSDDPETGNG